MIPDSTAREARARLGDTHTIALHLHCLTSAVRAILATHPNPDQVRRVFDQLLGQTLAHPKTLEDPDTGAVLRDFAATLFQPPSSPDS